MKKQIIVLNHVKYPKNERVKHKTSFFVIWCTIYKKSNYL